MAQSTPPNPPLPPITKGLEFEFALLWRFDSDDRGGKVEFPVEGNTGIHNGYIVVARDKLPEYESNWIEYLDGLKAARRGVYELLSKNGVDVHEPDYEKEERDLVFPVDPSLRWSMNTVNPRYHRWNVVPETMVDKFRLDQLDLKGTPFHAVDVELTSPAMTNGKEADDEIVRVVKLITDNLVYFVHEKCGFHVHVGQGPTMWAMEHLRKMAAVCYAMEIWFDDLHPEHRRTNDEFCPSLFKKSRLSQGMKGELANDYARRGVTPLFVDFPSMGPNPKVTLQEAWKELNDAGTAQAIHNLLPWPCAYNLTHVGGEAKGTVEFRQAAGTMNEVWAVHWSNLVCGLIDWARRATDDEVSELLLNGELVQAGAKKTYTVDDLIRKTLNLPEIADYIKGTTPDERATPRVTGQQAEWRKDENFEYDLIGPNMKPRANWP
ncbi:hypothetical protein PFICI_01690 [Pestalotiopsis fici W106-1]|uniref:Amidoligase enzyme n=1 Tax=Pestalotiopsis fici (strain W106-1 / CGMCC3.15140) TaxID=1229662 RepID=W3XQS3_PESFW|nr:uncharacterized protein PFICI_01690 [Pestalotiopsis fici W106-1]ETS87862.1 hypothetical protein PFICI_01690 [Pestalotiopsis fici W106-1]